MPNKAKKLLVIGHNWPEPKTTAAGHRMMQLLNAFLEQSYDIYFGSPAAKTEYSNDLILRGVHEIEIALNDSCFDALIRDIQPHIVIYDRFLTEEQFGWRVVENAPDALQILNTEDLHSLREYREHALKRGDATDYNKWLNTDKTKREMASIFRTDLTLVVSHFEESLLVEQVGLPKNHVLYLPFMLSSIDNEQIESWPSFEQRNNFVCFGNGRHAPNVDAVLQLKKKLWPSIKKQIPEAEVHIYGAYLPQIITQLHNEKEGFFIKGWVDDLDAVLLKSRINLAPLRFGAGIKGKLIDAMRNGLPSIATTIGAESMHGDLPWAGAVCTTDEDFIGESVSLFQDRSAWVTAQQQGAQIINTFYIDVALKVKLFSAIDVITKNLAQHRSENFIGRMLQHQSLSATKYMGKWIEEKNRKR